MRKGEDQTCPVCHGEGFQICTRCDGWCVDKHGHHCTRCKNTGWQICTRCGDAGNGGGGDGGHDGDGR